jgi:hypothetical protein
MEMTMSKRVILTMAIEADDAFVFEQLKTFQADMFAAGPVQLKFAYFGAEGARRNRPIITTNWITDADDMREIMDRGRAHCVCGCYIDVADILEQAVREAQQAPVQAVVIVFDHFHAGEHAVALAKELHKMGTRLFLIQRSRSSSHPVPEPAFRALAEGTGGAYLQFNPAVERVAERLPGMLEAVSHFAIGGTRALEALAQSDDEAALLLEQVLDHSALPHTN